MYCAQAQVAGKWHKADGKTKQAAVKALRTKLELAGIKTEAVTINTYEWRRGPAMLAGRFQ